MIELSNASVQDREWLRMNEKAGSRRCFCLTACGALLVSMSALCASAKGTLPWRCDPATIQPSAQESSPAPTTIDSWVWTDILSSGMNLRTAPRPGLFLIVK